LKEAPLKKCFAVLLLLVTSAFAHTVDLSWEPVSNVVGYNVYRGPYGGPYVEINTSLVTTNHYTDKKVTKGKTYFYVVTSVDNAGQESKYTPQIQATIPKKKGGK
jgi:fibronectin type 3 domain-containing protein